MHGLIFSSFQRFVTETYSDAKWRALTEASAVEYTHFEPMLHYDEMILDALLPKATAMLDRSEASLLEDIGTFLVSHPSNQALRRLLRFSGAEYTEFLQSLDDLHSRGKLALPDLELPHLRVLELDEARYELVCRSRYGFYGHVFIGLLRAMADDYGALVFLEHLGHRETEQRIAVTVIDGAYSAGKGFHLAAQTWERRKT